MPLNKETKPNQTNLLGATTLGQSGSVSDGCEGILCIPQSSRISGFSPSDCLVSYPGHLLSAEKQSVYSTAPTDWAKINLFKNYVYLIEPYAKRLLKKKKKTTKQL